MATSELGHYVRFSEALVGSEDFGDAGLCRRAVNNLDHLADQRGQVLVNWAPPAHYTLANYACTTYTSVTEVGVSYEVWRSTSFELSIRDDESSYRCRSRVYISSGHASHAATFSLVLAHADANPVTELSLAGPNVVTAAVTGTGFSKVAGSDLIYLNAGRVRRARTVVPIVDSVGGETFLATSIRARLFVLASVANASAEAALAGVHLAEYQPSE